MLIFFGFHFGSRKLKGFFAPFLSFFFCALAQHVVSLPIVLLFEKRRRVVSLQITSGKSFVVALLVVNTCVAAFLCVWWFLPPPTAQPCLCSPSRDGLCGLAGKEPPRVDGAQFMSHNFVSRTWREIYMQTAPSALKPRWSPSRPYVENIL